MSNYFFDQIRNAMPELDKTFIHKLNGERITYLNLLDNTARYANTLVQLGVMPDDRVAVQVEKTPEALFLYIACLRVGAVFLPLNTAYTDAETCFFLEDSSLSLFICDPARTLQFTNKETLDSHGLGSFANKAATAAIEFKNTARKADDCAAILYTSGTTGRSKGAMLTHENLASNARTLRNVWHFTSQDVLLHPLPIFHTHGLFVATNVTLMAGSSMIFIPKFETHQIIEHLPKATCLMGVPTFYVRLLKNAGLTRKTTKHMRLFISGSAPLLLETHQAWFERTGHAILERYGMSETNMNSSNPYDGERRAGTVGLPLPGVDIRIVDIETGQVLGIEQIGIIEIKGLNVFKGYWNMPEKTKAEFRDGYFTSGDLGKFDADGYLHIVGREKDLIISGGYNVYPKEVETQINAITGVVECAVFGVPHPDFGEAVMAVVVLETSVSLTEADIMAKLQLCLAKYKQPKQVFFVNNLPLNAMGKVQKNILREQYKDVFVVNGEYHPQKTLTQIGKY